MEPDLTGEVAVVTGASGGLGEYFRGCCLLMKPP